MKTQVWIAISVYVLVTIIKKRMEITHSPYTILHILSVIHFEKTSLFQALSNIKDSDFEPENYSQLNLFN